MERLIGVFLVLLIYKVILNIIRYYQAKKYKESYYLWLKSPNGDLVTHRSEIIKLFKDANVKDAFFPHVEPLGLGQIASYKVSIFTNFPSNYEDQAIMTVKKFNEAIGVYRNRITESFSPLYWINFIIFLPKNTFCYLGTNPENVIIKILQVIWWIAAFAITLFKPEIVQLIRSKVF